MKAIYLVKNGSAESAFETREVNTPEPKPHEVLIKVACFGLNFADVMARKGMYRDAPPMPSVIGYDVAGVVEKTGSEVKHLSAGDRVTAMTRFGGYAEYVSTDARAVAIIPDSMNFADATALTTQYCTAYYSAAVAVNLFKGDKVLIHSGAGGVGTALIQYARFMGCEIFSTAGSEAKLKMLSAAGVQHPINYSRDDFEKVIQEKTNGAGVDVVFDAVGGSNVKKGFRLLQSGGRMVCYGASSLSDKNIFGKIAEFIGFGFYHPVQFMMNSKSLIGVNMLRIADNKQEVLKHCLENVVLLTEKGVFKPLVGRVFPVKEIAAAHDYLESRKSSGKVVVAW